MIITARALRVWFPALTTTLQQTPVPRVRRPRAHPPPALWDPAPEVGIGGPLYGHQHSFGPLYPEKLACGQEQTRRGRSPARPGVLGAWTPKLPPWSCSQSAPAAACDPPTSLDSFLQGASTR